MSLFGSLFAGVSGLAAQSRAMGLISDNVANVNTTAYKGASAQFSTLVTGSPRAQSYTPGGVRASAFQTVAAQGPIQGTSSSTDAAISGAGFFVVNGKADGSTEQLYTRAGSFAPDAQGNLTTPAGFFLQGWPLDAKGQVANVNALQTVNVNAVGGAAAPTSEIHVGANLDANQAAFPGAYAAGDMASYLATDGANGAQPQFSREIQVYDSLGRAHTTTLAFMKTATPNAWNVELVAAPGDVDPTAHPNGLLASGTVTFDGTGKLVTNGLTSQQAGGAAGEVGIKWAAAQGAADSSVALDLGTAGAADGLTQFASPSDVGRVVQNGAAIGQLSGVSIDNEGNVIASFTNNQQRKIYKLPVATFANPGGLDPRSGTLYAQTDASGLSNLHASATGGAGQVTPAALEASNVDLADEFTKMIVTQRAYSANAKVITTTDDMLSELLNLRR